MFVCVCMFVCVRVCVCFSFSIIKNGWPITNESPILLWGYILNPQRNDC